MAFADNIPPPPETEKHTPTSPRPDNGVRDENNTKKKSRFGWGARNEETHSDPSKRHSGSDEGSFTKRRKWTMGMLNDKETDEVPGTLHIKKT